MIKAISLAAGEAAALTGVAATGAAYLVSADHPIFYFLAIFSTAFAGYLGYRAHTSAAA